MSPPLRIWTAHRLLVCVPADLPERTTTALRDRIAQTPSIDAVLDVLTADGLAATPPFACAADHLDGTRVVIRGDLRAVAHGLDGSTLALSSGRSATWNDDVIADIARISLDLGAERGQVEWLAATTPPATPPIPPVAPNLEPVPEPEPEPEPADPHTLDEAAFLELRDAQVDPPVEPEPELPPPPPPPPVAPPPTDALDFSQLLDDTNHRLPPPPPPPPPPPVDERTGVTGLATAPPPPPPPADAGTGMGEHDGRTITLADLRQMQTAPPPPATDATDPADAPTARAREVRAVRCPAGHPNPPTIGACRRCGAGITDPTVIAVPRPVVARLVFDSGLVVDVDRPQLIGRRPMAPADAEDLPNLVTIPSPDGDISRGHTAVRLEGWDVLVEDLGSTNGTEIRLPGAEPVRLREHEPVLAVVGTQVVLAGTVRFTIQAPE